MVFITEHWKDLNQFLILSPYKPFELRGAARLAITTMNPKKQGRSPGQCGDLVKTKQGERLPPWVYI